MSTGLIYFCLYIPEKISVNETLRACSYFLLPLWKFFLGGSICIQPAKKSRTACRSTVMFPLLKGTATTIPAQQHINRDTTSSDSGTCTIILEKYFSLPFCVFYLVV